MRPCCQPSHVPLSPLPPPIIPCPYRTPLTSAPARRISPPSGCHPPVRPPATRKRNKEQREAWAVRPWREAWCEIGRLEMSHLSSLCRPPANRMDSSRTGAQRHTKERRGDEAAAEVYHHSGLTEGRSTLALHPMHACAKHGDDNPPSAQAHAHTLRPVDSERPDPLSSSAPTPLICP